jgi:hypothetical protein
VRDAGKLDKNPEDQKRMAALANPIMTEDIDPFLELCHADARVKHKGQRRHTPPSEYIVHPEEMADKQQGRYYKAVSYYHDVVENALEEEHKCYIAEHKRPPSAHHEREFVQSELVKIVDYLSRHGYEPSYVIEDNLTVRDLIEDVRAFTRYRAEPANNKVPSRYMDIIGNFPEYQKYIKMYGATNIQKLHRYMWHIEGLADYAERVGRPRLMKLKRVDIQYNAAPEHNKPLRPDDTSREAMDQRARVEGRYPIADRYLEIRIRRYEHRLAYGHASHAMSIVSSSADSQEQSDPQPPKMPSRSVGGDSLPRPGSGSGRG